MITTHGVKPMKFWRLFEIEGFQLLVYIQDHEDDDTHVQLVFESAFAQTEERSKIALTGPAGSALEEAFKERLENMDERNAASMLQKLLDAVAPVIVTEEETVQ